MRKPLLATAAITLVLVCMAPTAHSADIFVTLTSAADADELVRSDYTLLARQRLVSWLTIRGHRLFGQGSEWAERDALRFVLDGRLETDFSRRVLATSEDVREREAVDLVLQRAYLHVSPVEELTIRLGRLLVHHPVSSMDIDGFSFLVSSDPLGEGGWTWNGQLDLGREIRLETLGLSSDLFDLPGSRWNAFSDEQPESTWVSQASFGLTNRRFALALGHQLRLRHDDLIGHSSGFGAHLNLVPIAAHLRACLDHVRGDPTRMDATVSAPIGVLDSTLHLGWRLNRPTFDGDSIFNVFNLSPSVRWRLVWELQPNPDLRFSLAGHLTGYETQGDTPWLGGLHGSAEETAAGGTSQAWLQLLPTLLLNVNLSIESGTKGLFVFENVGTQWNVSPQSLSLALTVRHTYREAESASRWHGHQLGGRVEGSFQLSSFGNAALWTEVVDDFRFGPVLSAMAVVQFDLGPF